MPRRRQLRLYGPGELAALFGVSRSRVLQITRRPGFPAPVAKLIGTTIWDADEVDEWARHNRPRRPDTDEDEQA
jgi:predicted DNA-binding transcriptional regulator AlpA